MAYLVFLLIALVLFVGFVVLTRQETRRGSRYFAAERMQFDADTERFITVFAHADFPTFVKSIVRALIARIAHDAAHGSLIVVRFLERLLTRAVRTLRIHHASVSVSTTASPSSDFVTAMKDLKQELRNGRKIEEVVGDTIENRE